MSRTERRNLMRRPMAQLAAAVQRQDYAAAARVLRSLQNSGGANALNAAWIDAEARALESGDWTTVGEMFRRGDFVGAEGEFLIVADYTMRRDAGEIRQLSFVHARVLDLPEENLDADLQAVFPTVGQPVTRILPVHCFATGGTLDGEGGEAFIVPDGWCLEGSAAGPALNNMTEQSRRFESAGRACVLEIFTPETARLLLAPLTDPAMRAAIQHKEYSYHEAGHASGFGLQRKFEENLIPTYSLRAVEEWRADGVAFHIARQRHDRREAGLLVASNLCTRFGLDAHRAGGEERDTDVNAAELTLQSLVENGAFTEGGRKLALRDPSYEGLARAVERMAHEAVRLTELELELTYRSGLQGLYARAPKPATRLLFQVTVTGPCKGKYAALR